MDITYTELYPKREKNEANGKIFLSPLKLRAGIGKSVLILATGWTGRGSDPGVMEVFRTRPDRPWSPPSLL